MSLLGVLFLVNAIGAMPPTAASDLAVENCDFGEIYAFTSTTCNIAFGNDSAEAVRITNVVAVSPGDSTESGELTIAPHGKAYLSVRVDAGNANGPSSHVFRYQIVDSSGTHDARVLARGFVMSALEESLPAVDFGIVNIDDKLPEKSITLASHETSSFRILNVIEKPAWLDVALMADRATIKVGILSSAPLGAQAQFIKVAIDTPRQKQAWVSVTADLRGDVVPATNPLDMGLIRSGDRNDFRIPLVSRSGKDFKLGKISLDNIKGEFQVIPCEPASAGCKWLQLSVSKEQPLGNIKGSLSIEFPEQHRSLRIAVKGLMVTHDFRVKTLDTDAISKAEAAGQSPGTPAVSMPDLGEAIKHSIERTEEMAPLPGTGPRLRWTIANGRTIYGFQIFRSTSPDGPFLLQNVPALRASASDDSPKAFQWRDNTAEAGKTYWYYIGTVDINGKKARPTGPQKVVAK